VSPIVRFALVPILVLLATLPAPAAAPPFNPMRDHARKVQGRYAYGFYFQKGKIGWIVEEYKLGQYDGKEALIKTFEMHMTVLRDKEKMVKTEKSVEYYALQGDGPLLYIEKRARQDSTETVRRSVRKGDQMIVTTRQGDRTTRQVVGAPKANLAGERRFTSWLAQAKKGDTIERWTAGGAGSSPDSRETCTFVRKQSGVRHGKPVFAVVLASTGMRMDAELFGNGVLYRGALSGGMMTFRLEKEAVARRLDVGKVDVLRDLSISLDRDLGKKGHDLRKLTLEVSGLDGYKLPQSHRQHVRAGKEKAVVVDLYRDYRTARTYPLNGPEKNEYSRSTPRLQSDNETIRKQGKNIVGQEKEPMKVATLLSQWVHANVRKTYSENPETALACLDRKAGDCKVHSLLFVSLARASGLPAREAFGLAYGMVGGKPRFVWHAWAEVHDGRQWVSIDPTWGQVHADATHLKFSDGTGDPAWRQLVGKVKIKVMKQDLVKLARAG
jgi:hypothetical protein